MLLVNDCVSSRRIFCQPVCIDIDTTQRYFHTSGQTCSTILYVKMHTYLTWTCSRVWYLHIRITVATNSPFSEPRRRLMFEYRRVQMQLVHSFRKSVISFKKTFCLMNFRPEDLLSHEPTRWLYRHWCGVTAISSQLSKDNLVSLQQVGLWKTFFKKTVHLFDWWLFLLVETVI